jgi:hypothetical protein
MIEEKLNRFTSRDVVDVNTTVPVSFEINDFKSILSINSENDFLVLKFIWDNYGECSFKKGLFWTINPNEFMHPARLFPKVSKKAIPIIRTVTGCLFLWDYFDDEYVIMYLDVHYNKYEFYGDTFEELFNFDLISNAVWNDQLNGKREKMALSTISSLNRDECVVPLPAIVEGGEFKRESLKKEKIIEHLTLLSQLHLKN